MAARRAREADPMTQLTELAHGLDAGLQPAYVMRGEERYFREKGIGLVKQKAEEAGLELCAHDASDPDFNQHRLLEDLSGAGLFATARCVIVRSAEKVLKKSGKDDAPLVRKVLANLGAGEGGGETSGSVLVLAATSLRADSKVAKAVAKCGGVLVTCRKLWDTPPPWNPDPRSVELVGFVRRRASKFKIQLSESEAVYVAAATGNDLYAIEDQLEKLRHVPAAERRQALGWESAGNPFQLADQLVRGDSRRALLGIESLFRKGFQESDGKRNLDRAALTAILTGSLRRLVRDGAARSSSPDGAEPANSSRGEKDAAARAQLRPHAEWRRLLDELADVERRAKSGADPDANDFALLALSWSRTS